MTTTTRTTAAAASSSLSLPPFPSSLFMLVPSWGDEYMRIKEMTAVEIASSSSLSTSSSLSSSSSSMDTTLVPHEHIWGQLIPHTMYIINIITVVFVVSAYVLRYKFPKKETKFIYEVSYLITTLCGNLVLGLLGTYYFLTIMERPSPSVDRMVLGYPSSSSSIYVLSCLQMAKNLWAIPIGFTIIQERWEMMAHHMACVLVVGMAASMTMGFTYFAPVVFGMLELSSIPLAIMTFFKLNPEYAAVYPGPYAMIRLVFGVSFLGVRWGIAVPYLCTMLRLIAFRIHALLYYHYHPATTTSTSFQHDMTMKNNDIDHDPSNIHTTTTTTTTIIMILLSFTWLATFFLTILQVHWGYLILKGMIKSIVPSSQSMDQHKKKKET